MSSLEMNLLGMTLASLSVIILIFVSPVNPMRGKRGAVVLIAGLIAWVGTVALISDNSLSIYVHAGAALLNLSLFLGLFLLEQRGSEQEKREAPLKLASYHFKEAVRELKLAEESQTNDAERLEECRRRTEAARSILAEHFHLDFGRLMLLEYEAIEESESDQRWFKKVLPGS